MTRRARLDADDRDDEDAARRARLDADDRDDEDAARVKMTPSAEERGIGRGGPEPPR